jgi:outer membrane protein TolC
MNRVFIPTLSSIALLLAAEAPAAEPRHWLPEATAVEKVLRTTPGVLASGSQLRAEEANRARLEAGEYEWNLRLNGQQRRSNPPAAAEERFGEWSAALERPLRLPGKAGDDAQLGAAGIAVAESARGDALHETGRTLLKAWFSWLKENAAAEQWARQMQLLGKQANAAKRRQQLGDAARLEAVQAEAALAQAEAQAAQARIRRDNAALEVQRRFPGLPLTPPPTAETPPAIEGSAQEWIERIVEHSHEIGVARGEAQRARIAASRAGRDRLPDPTIGVQVSRERGGEDNIVGAYISIPLPGGGRRAAADGALALASAASHREAAALQKVGLEAATLHQSAHAAIDTWQAARTAAERLTLAADMSARAYALGEGNLLETLMARRQAHEAQLAERLALLDAFELRYRLLLDAHQLWAHEDAPLTAHSD